MKAMVLLTMLTMTHHLLLIIVAVEAGLLSIKLSLGKNIFVLLCRYFPEQRFRCLLQKHMFTLSELKGDSTVNASATVHSPYYSLLVLHRNWGLGMGDVDTMVVGLSR